jgi:histidinol phosphatase-like PHP family hydrolase
MTNPPEPNQPVDMQALIRLIESNAKAIEAVTNQQQIDRELARLDREAYLELARQSREELQESRVETREDIGELRQLIESNAKAIEAAGNQQAADRDLARVDRELNIQSREETRDDIRQLAALMREDRERGLTLEREIRMQSGEIQNLADSIQVLYSRQPPPSS